jgi:hypothetical protein
VSRKTVKAPSFVKESTTSAVITLGEESAGKLGVPAGSQIDLGMIAYYHRNPIRRFIGRRRRVNKAGFDLSTPQGIEAARRALVTQ